MRIAHVTASDFRLLTELSTFDQGPPQCMPGHCRCTALGASAAPSTFRECRPSRAAAQQSATAITRSWAATRVPCKLMRRTSRAVHLPCQLARPYRKCMMSRQQQTFDWPFAGAFIQVFRLQRRTPQNITAALLPALMIGLPLQSRRRATSHRASTRRQSPAPLALPKQGPARSCRSCIGFLLRMWWHARH